MAGEPWQISRDMFLEESEVEQLLADVRRRTVEADAGDATPVVDQLIIEILVFSGLRPSEFCRLRVQDARLKAAESSLEITEGAGQHRSVSIPRWLSQAIAGYLKKIRPLFLDVRNGADSPTSPLILNERGRGYERTSLYRRVTRILTTAGLGERASVQLLRHTYGYLAYKRSGGNLLFVQRQLGHAHPMVTAIYAQFEEERPTELANQIGTANRPQPS
ncbi:MAG: site-specific integrase [Planctomycetaceae bacterium]|nr:site-specific integrase [Planctomycetaceae bacterium]